MADTQKPRKEHKIVDAQPNGEAARVIKDAPATGNSTGFRIGAVVLWVLAIVCEVLAVLVVNGTVDLAFIPALAQLIVFIVLDLIFLLIGSFLWKKANHIKPMSEKNKALFWLWNNMGVIVSVIAFVPFIVLLLLNKNADAKTKKIASIIAIVALLIGGIGSYDFDPISAEEKEAAMSTYGDTMVYWTPFGKVYHTHEDCSSLNQTDTLTRGTVEQAIAANRTRICKYCEKRDGDAGVTGGSTVGDIVEDILDNIADDAQNSEDSAE